MNGNTKVSIANFSAPNKHSLFVTPFSQKKTNHNKCARISYFKKFYNPICTSAMPCNLAIKECCSAAT